MWWLIANAVAAEYLAYKSQGESAEPRPDDWQLWRMEQQRRADIEAGRTRRQALLGALLLVALVVSASWMIWEMWG